MERVRKRGRLKRESRIKRERRGERNKFEQRIIKRERHHIRYLKNEKYRRDLEKKRESD
jgi:hypothetical protein